MLIEGIAITCYALDIHLAYVYIRGEFPKQARILEKAIEEARAAGIIGARLLGKKDFDLDIHVHRGAGAYICGEESALLESLEGKKGYPRLKPPFPAVVGLWGKPTIINNVETIANIPWIVANGGDAFAALGVGQVRRHAALRRLRPREPAGRLREAGPLQPEEAHHGGLRRDRRRPEGEGGHPGRLLLARCSAATRSTSRSSSTR